MIVDGKVAVVVGGTTGMGRACVEVLLEKGAKVYFGDNQDDLAEAVIESLKTKYPGSQHQYRRCDIRKLTDIQDLMTSATREFGQVEIFLNTAGIFDEIDFGRCIDINLTGAIRCCDVAIKTMGRNHGGQGGVVVLIASMGGLQPSAWCPVYIASKHGIVGLTRSWAMPENYEANGIRFNCICPATVDTPFLHTVIHALPEYVSSVVQHHNSLGPEEKISPAVVAEGFITLVEDDKHNGRAMRISKTYGIDFAPFADAIAK